MDSKEYQNVLADALEARRDWLENTEFPKLKDECRKFQTSFAAIYRQLLQKRLIHEDPYKNEAKAGSIKIPAPVTQEGDKKDQLTVCLSAYDNQLDFLVNFSQFSADFLTMENIKRILALIKFIDWNKFTLESTNVTTKILVDVVTQAKTGGDPLSARVLNESISNLDKATTSIMGYLKTASIFNQELYKLELRQAITSKMQASEATTENIRKKFNSALPGRPFYPNLVEELIKEDFSASGEKLREAVLKKIEIVDNKPKVVKAEVSFKTTLFDGFVIISSISPVLNEIAPKMDENNATLQNAKNGFFEHFKTALRQMFHQEPKPILYDIEYMDPNKGTPVKEKVDFNAFRADLDRKIRAYGSLSGRSGISARLEALDEKQLLPLLDRAVRDAQTIQKTLTGLDEFFKTAVPREMRDKIKGIKPELATIKNAFIRANQKRHEYSAQMEENEQLKRLGVNM